MLREYDYTKQIKKTKTNHWDSKTDKAWIEGIREPKLFTEKPRYLYSAGTN